MPDLLRVTQPITSNENNIGRARPQDQPPQPTIVNVPDPSRVTKTTDQTVYSERQNQRHDPNVKSNFDHFVGLLRSTPYLSQTITQLIFTRMGNVVNSGISEDFAANIAKFMDLLNMNEAELLQFVLNQGNTSAKFSGEIFDMLRQSLSGSNSSDMTNAILQFVKTFDNASSNGQLINSIIANLKNIAQYMPKSKGEELLSLANKLIASAEQGSNPANMNTLKTEIFPYLSKYITQTKDFGSIRDIISTLTANYVNYENGSVDNLMQSFEKLFNYPQLADKLSQIPAEQIEAMLLNARFKNADTRLMDLFVNIISNGLTGGSDATNKEVFENILKSLLINNSVYMPVEHMIVPVFINGRHMFSEIWVDPDASSSSGDDSDENTAKLLVKFDIENIGFFELVMLYKGGNAELLMFCPPALSKKYDSIKLALQKILENNGITCQNIAVEKSVQPLVISDVFPKIFEKRDSINVKV